MDTLAYTIGTNKRSTRTCKTSVFPRAPYILAIRRSHQKIGSVQRLNQESLNRPLDIKKFQVSRQDPKCPEVKLGIPKPTSGHQQVTRSRCPEVGLGNLDSTSERSQKVKSRKRKPTSGHQERPAKVVDRKKRRRQNKDANNDFEHIQTMQNHCVFIGFKHITTFEAISTTTTVNGTGARSTFHKFT